MAFCSQCGASLASEMKFCPSCGAQVSSSQQPINDQKATPDQQGPSPRGYQAPIMPGAPAQADINDAQENKGMAILAYILFFIPLLTGAHRSSPFAKYHTNQGLVLFLFSAALGIVVSILTGIISAIFISSLSFALTGGGFFGVLMFLFWLLFLIPLVFCIIGIINAANGRMRPLPLIGRFTLIK